MRLLLWIVDKFMCDLGTEPIAYKDRGTQQKSHCKQFVTLTNSYNLGNGRSHILLGMKEKNLPTVVNTVQVLFQVIHQR